MRPRGAHLVWVGLILASAAVSTWAQPAGTGAGGVLLEVLCIARLLPARAVVPVPVLAFVAAVTSGSIARRDDLVTFAAIATVHLAWLLSEADKRPERLLTDRQHSRRASTCAWTTDPSPPAAPASHRPASATAGPACGSAPSCWAVLAAGAATVNSHINRLLATIDARDRAPCRGLRPPPRARRHDRRRPVACGT